MATLLSIMCSPKIGGFTEALLHETLHGVREVSGVKVDEIFLPDYQFHTCSLRSVSPFPKGVGGFTS